MSSLLSFCLDVCQKIWVVWPEDMVGLMIPHTALDIFSNWKLPGRTCRKGIWFVGKSARQDWKGRWLWGNIASKTIFLLPGYYSLHSTHFQFYFKVIFIFLQIFSFYSLYLHKNVFEYYNQIHFFKVSKLWHFPIVKPDDCKTNLIK